MNTDRFWSHVDKQGPDQCWPWSKAKNRDGYGTVRLQKRMVRTHRIAYELTYGPIPDGLCVLHQCDNPPCCNPAHLRLGTREDNAQDRAAKRRGFIAIGVTNGGAILSDHEVHTLRRMYASGKYSANKLARIFVVSRKTVQNILAGKIWKHVS